MSFLAHRSVLTPVNSLHHPDSPMSMPPTSTFLIDYYRRKCRSAPHSFPGEHLPEPSLCWLGLGLLLSQRKCSRCGADSFQTVFGGTEACLEVVELLTVEGKRLTSGTLGLETKQRWGTSYLRSMVLTRLIRPPSILKRMSKISEKSRAMVLWEWLLRRSCEH